MMGLHKASPLLQSMPNMSFKQLRHHDSVGVEGFQTMQMFNPETRNPPLQHTRSALEERVHSPKHSLGNILMKQITPKKISSPSDAPRKTISMFEEFFIIGADKEELTKLDWNKSSRQYVSP